MSSWFFRDKDAPPPESAAARVQRESWKALLADTVWVDHPNAEYPASIVLPEGKSFLKVERIIAQLGGYEKSKDAQSNCPAPNGYTCYRDYQRNRAVPIMYPQKLEEAGIQAMCGDRKRFDGGALAVLSYLHGLVSVANALADRERFKDFQGSKKAPPGC